MFCLWRCFILHLPLISLFKLCCTFVFLYFCTWWLGRQGQSDVRSLLGICISVFCISVFWMSIFSCLRFVLLYIDRVTRQERGLFTFQDVIFPQLRQAVPPVMEIKLQPFKSNHLDIIITYRECHTQVTISVRYEVSRHSQECPLFLLPLQIRWKTQACWAIW